MPLRIILTTGGTGGHIFPALAVAESIKKYQPDADILFVGGLYGPEKTFAQNAGLKFVGLHAKGFQRQGLKTFAALPALIKSFYASLKILKNFRPDVVIGFGGYAAFPTVFSAILLKIPTGIHEQNAFAGLANKILGKLVNKIFISWSDTLKHTHFPQQKCIVTGNPVRSEIASVKTCSNKDIPTLLVMGGSLGAKAINQLVLDNLQYIKNSSFRLIHQTGKLDYERVKQAYFEAGFTKKDIDSIVIPFIDNMAETYQQCSLALCRAGATSLAELALTGTPSILIPFPFAANDHQTYNALAMQEAGGGICLLQKTAIEKNHDGSFFHELSELLHNTDKLASMKKSAYSLAKPNAADDIAKEIFKLAKLK